MIIKPKIRGFICTTAHPAGCAQHVQQQIDYVKQQKPLTSFKKVLVVGASTGYGLASRIALAFGAQAATIGVAFERPADGKRTATAGWYNTAAFETAAHQAGLYAKSLNGDAFSNELKQQTIELIKRDLRQVDCVIYSLASPRRTDPKTGEVYNSCLKTVGEPYTNKTVNPLDGTISEVTIEPANQEEIDNTVKVMGGEDWQLWIDALKKANVLAEGVVTVAYSYIGPELTHPMYRAGTIGRAKDHLEATANALTKALSPLHGKAYVSVNKAVVTQSSAAIPVVPLYISVLFKIMQGKGNHEGCIEQMYRLFSERLQSEKVPVDDAGRIRIDDWEMQADVQDAVNDAWQKISDNNIQQLADLKHYQHDFYQLFGFDVAGVDYDADVEPDVAIESLK